MSTYQAPPKDPDATLDYTIDWSDYLDGDTIADSSWIIETGLTEVSSANTTTAATVFVSGGVAGQSYTLTNRIVTDGGRTDDRTISVPIFSR